MRFIFTSLICYCLSSIASGQIFMTNSNSLSEILQSEFGGQMDNISNIHLNYLTTNIPGSTIDSYTSINANLALPHGLIMSTTEASSMIGPNLTGNITQVLGDEQFTFTDADVQEIMLQFGDFQLDGGVVLEFDFTASMDSLKIAYIWGSEEYSNFVGYYNDAFGIFLSGPGLAGEFQNNAVNIATIPGTDLPVCISTLNNGSDNLGPCVNCNYYNQPINDNQFPLTLSDSGLLDPLNTALDGYSDVFYATSPLICGQTYHIKFSIFNSFDTSFPSAVFMTGNVYNNNTTDMLSENSLTYYENCSDQIITFSRPVNSDPAADLEIDVDLFGTATENLDFTDIPSIITIPAGQTSVDLPLSVFADQIADNNEFIGMNLLYNSNCASVSEILTITISEQSFPLSIPSDSFTACPGTYIPITPEVFGGSGNLEYAWSNNITTLTDTILFVNDTMLTLTVTDLCTSEIITTNFYVTAPGDVPLSIFMPETITAVCGFHEIELVAIGGSEPYTFFIDGVSYPNDIGSNIQYTFYESFGNPELNITVMDGCMQFASGIVHVEYPFPLLDFELPDTLIVACYDSAYQVEPVFINGPSISGFWKWNDGLWFGDFEGIPWYAFDTENGYLHYKASNNCFVYKMDSIWIERDGIAIPEVIIDGQPACSGDTVELAAFFSPDISYQWFNDGVAIPNETSHIYYATEQGNYNLEVTSAFCQESATCEVVTPEIYPNTVADFTYTLDGLSCQFQNTSTNYNGQYWYFGDSNQSFDQNPLHVFEEEGTYNILLIVYSNSFCGNDTLYGSVTITSLVKEFADFSSVGIYPNPVHETIHLTSSSIHDELHFFELSDAQGKLILAKPMHISSPFEFSYTFENPLPSGVYFLSLHFSEQSIHKRIVVE